MTKPTDDDLLKIAQHLTSNPGGKGRHSPLFRWLFKRASAFEKLLTETQPSWESTAEAFKRLDLKDGAGKHPTSQCVRQTWIKVKRAKGWLTKRPSAPVSAPSPAPSATYEPPATWPTPAAGPAPYYPAADDDDGEFVLRTLSRPTKRG